MATPSSNFASATARYVRGVRYATSRGVVISTTSVRASSASRSKVWTPPSADTVNVGPAAQTDVGIVRATNEKANVTASPIIVVGISEASLDADLRRPAGVGSDTPPFTPKRVLCRPRGPGHGDQRPLSPICGTFPLFIIIPNKGLRDP